jgi:3-deoxy-D-manno-octulosonic-acid transferase
MEEVKSLIQNSGRPWSLWSEVKKNGRWTTSVLLVDTLGDLKDLYACADVAFVGGSLVAHGGQNPLEPAAAGLPVVFGPSMENFHEECEDLLKSGGAIQVKDETDLKQLLDTLMKDPFKRRDMGHFAQEAVRHKQGASQLVVKTLIEDLGLANG